MKIKRKNKREGNLICQILKKTKITRHKSVLDYTFNQLKAHEVLSKVLFWLIVYLKCKLKFLFNGFFIVTLKRWSNKLCFLSYYVKIDFVF